MYSVAAHGEGEAAGVGLDQLAVDVNVVAQPLVKHAIDLADRHPGLRDLDLQVGRPGVMAVQTLGDSACGVLQSLQGVEHLAGDRLAGDAAGREDGRRLKSVDDDVAAVQRVAQHDEDADAEGADREGGQDLGDHPHPLADAPDPPFAQLISQLLHAQVVLVLDAMDLHPQQVGLVAQEFDGGAGHRRIVPRAVCHDSGRIGAGADQIINGGFVFGGLRLFPDQRAQQAFRHRLAPATNARPPGARRRRRMPGSGIGRNLRRPRLRWGACLLGARVDCQRLSTLAHDRNEWALYARGRLTWPFWRHIPAGRHKNRINCVSKDIRS
jgi:hypothetical protein